jgi:L-threonylcarbamoyladenylate synthase
VVKQDLLQAVRILRAGGLVAFPTETVYGLGADAQNERAVRRIFAVKGRPASHPVIVHLGDPSQLDAWARSVPAIAYELARVFWPGPLTMVLKRSARASDAVTGGQDTVGLRVPATPLARQLLEAFGGGIAAPSANRYGRVSPTTAEDVRAELGEQVDAILDGGPCLIGVESTILDLSSGSPALIRPGGVSREELEQILGDQIPLGRVSGVRAPGMQPTHYAPATRIVIAEHSELAAAAELERRKGHAVVVVAPEGFSLPAGLAHLPVPERLEEYAQVLYRTLREVDRQHFDVAIFWVPPATGLGLAIRDRLARAAGADPKD